MGQVQSHPARLHLRIGKHVCHGIDWPAWNAGVFQRIEPFAHRSRQENLAQSRDQLVAIVYPRCVGREALVADEVGASDDFAQARVLVLVSHRDDDVAVARGKNLVGHDIRMCVAQALRCNAGDEIIHRLVREDRHLCVEQREVDVLPRARAVAMGKRAENRDRRVEAGEDIGHRDTHFHWAATRMLVGLAGDAHQTADSLDHEIVAGLIAIGPGLAESGYRTIDQAGVERLE